MAVPSTATGHSWNSYCCRQKHLNRSDIHAEMHRGDCTGDVMKLFNPTAARMLSKVRETMSVCSYVDAAIPKGMLVRRNVLSCADGHRWNV